MDFDPGDRLYEANEAGKPFQVTGQTMRLWARKGRIPAVKIGRKYLFRESDLRRLMAESEVRADGAGE